MAKNRLLFFFLFIVSKLYCNDEYAYIIYFNDKITCSPVKDSTLFNPDGYQRRKENTTSFNQYDCPVNEHYIKAICELGFTLHGRSKWLNAIAVKTTDTSILSQLSSFNFIKRTQILSVQYDGENTESIHARYILNDSEILQEKYGYGYHQINCEKGIYLHEKGFKGQGIKIAILDGGFSGVDTIIAFKKLFQTGRLAEAYDFVENDKNPYHGSSHGTEVLSTMAANQSKKLIGTAPEATYCLFRTEDTRSEQLIEEFNIARALEYADSIGVQLVNISLGYTNYDYFNQSYSWSDLTRQESIAVQAINIADQKGILVVVSAGNEGDEYWKYIAVPGNASGALTIGAVDSEKNLAAFSSIGYTEMRTIKPDICAMGSYVATIDDENALGMSDGTSFSTPITTGLIACLWQAFPTSKASQIKDVVKKSASQYKKPDLNYGYGVPNFEHAFWLLSYAKNMNSPIMPTEYAVYPKYYHDKLILLTPKNNIDTFIEIQLFDFWGNCISKEPIHLTNAVAISIQEDTIKWLEKGAYFIKLIGTNSTIVQKIIKQ